MSDLEFRLCTNHTAILTYIVSGRMTSVAFHCCRNVLDNDPRPCIYASPFLYTIQTYSFLTLMIAHVILRECQQASRIKWDLQSPYNCACRVHFAASAKLSKIILFSGCNTLSNTLGVAFSGNIVANISKGPSVYTSG